MAGKQRSCIHIIIVVLLITTLVEYVLGEVRIGIRIDWSVHKRKIDLSAHKWKRDNGKNNSYNLRLPCGIEQFDANADGYLDLEEFAKAAEADSSDPRLIAGFDLLDKDGDLKLSIEEQIKAMPSRCTEKEMEAIKEKAEKAGVAN